MSEMRRVLPVGALLVLVLVVVTFSLREVPAAAAPPAPAPAAAQSGAPASPAGDADPHAKVYAENRYPSAAVCATCHPQQYDEWRYSAHAYASISPMFHKFEQRISELAQGTVGYFCMRCHASVGTSLKEPREEPLWQRSRVSREGVTCITCHRVNENFAKVNGERRIVPGDLHQPVYGGISGNGVQEVVENKQKWNVAVAPGDFGLQMHKQGIQFKQIAQSEFCVSCHQVAVHPGIKLETVWDEYRASPAIQKGTRCMDCHMSTRPGQASGFATGPAAVVNGKSVNTNRTHYNHAFVGPGYPITHPGIFPHHPDAERFSVDTWLSFDYRAGWGSDAFEDKVSKGQVKVSFPAAWASPDDRAEAWLIVQDNLKKINEKRDLRRQLMEDGSRIDGPFFAHPPKQGDGLTFSYKVTNLDPGHNLPSGSLGAQPEIWLNVALIDPSGRNVWESGYLDHNGDMCDLHSLEVRAGKIPADNQLFNLQSKFLTTNLKGTDREMYLPVPFDADQLPFIRPSEIPTSVLNHPPTVRMEKRSLPPLGSRFATYHVPAGLMTKPGTYRLAVRLRSRAEPMYFMKFCRATADMEQAMNEWMLDFHAYTVEFPVGGAR
jgi:cytochrome c553